MRFPNATKGIKRIVLAEILALIAAVAIAVTAMMIPNAETAAPTMYVILLAGASILSILAFVFNILGLVNARKDDDNFKIALYCALLGIVISIVAAFFQNNPTVSQRLNSAVNIDNLLTSFFTLTGIMSLANQLKDSATEKKARTSRTWLIVAFLVGLFSANLVISMAQNGSNALIFVGIVNIVVQVVTYIIYLRGLIAGRNMLVNK